ncbi:MAG: head decoration protein [Magnetococcales bacterium]|nr:head decoration protein [Magnetococcales bacterium]
MAVISEGSNLGDLLKYEAPSFYSRDTVTVASGQNLVLGAVVGIKTADGKVHTLDPAATDGTETAAGVLLQAVNATSADVDAVMVTRHALVADVALVWPAGITTNQKSAAIAHLKGIGILIRKGA